MTTLREAAAQALEALNNAVDQLPKPYSTECDQAADDLQAALAQQEQEPQYEPIELHVLHSHFAGLLFDFMGWLTTRKERLTLSSTDEAGPAAEAITEFAQMRGLMLEDAQVQHWQAILTTPQPQPKRRVTYVCPVCAASLERQE